MKDNPSITTKEIAKESQDITADGERHNSDRCINVLESRVSGTL